MPATSRREFAPPLPDHNLLISLGILKLAEMPPAQRNARLLLVEFIDGMPKEDLALFAKIVQPHLTDDEIADLCGVCIRTVYRWERYQSIKPRLADYLETKRRQWYMPDDPTA